MFVFSHFFFAFEMPQGATTGTGMTQNLLVFHPVSSSSVSFFPLPGPICNAFGQMYLMETPKGNNNNISALEGLQRVPCPAKTWSISRSIYLYQ